jgi:hypothetical protein
MKYLILPLIILTGCAQTNLPDGGTMLWIAPLPNGTGPSIQTSSNSGVSINSYTVRSGGQSSSFTVIGGRGK